MRTKRRNPLGTPLRAALFATIMMILLLYVPSPYLSYEPGLVAPVAPMVTIERPDESGEGSFLLTTVFMTEANFWQVISSLWRDEILLMDRKSVFGNQSQEEYRARLIEVMQTSQDYAIEAAYRYLGIEYALVPYRLVIASVERENKQAWQEGDVVLQLNGVNVNDAEQLAEVIRLTPEAEQLTAVVRRDNEELALPLPPFDVPRAAVSAELLPELFGGVELAQLRRIATNDASYGVSIAAGEIGGPSAGLIFALQIIDALSEGDLADGRRVAGTGTVAPDGTVGAVGGVALKVAAAHRQGAQVFLAPRENVVEARAKAAALRSPMRVEAAASLEDAIKALAGLDQPPAVISKR